MSSPIASSQPRDDKNDVFDVSNWLDRATAGRQPAQSDYVPKHRAAGPAR